MRIVHTHSHLGGAEILKLRFPEIDAQIDQAITATGSDFKTKISGEQRRRGAALFDPKAINAALKREFNARGFCELHWTVAPNIPGLDVSKTSSGVRRIDFAKERVLVEVQLGMYAAMLHDMTKFEYCYQQNQADVGIEIVPSSHLAADMSSGFGRGEALITDLLDLQGQLPTVPVKIILIQP